MAFHAGGSTTASGDADGPIPAVIGRRRATAAAASGIAVVVEALRRELEVDDHRAVAVLLKVFHEQRRSHDGRHLVVIGDLHRAQVHQPVDVVAATRRLRDHHAPVRVTAQHGGTVDRVEHGTHGRGVDVETRQGQIGRQIGDTSVIEEGTHRSQHQPSWNAPCTSTTVIMAATLPLGELCGHGVLHRRPREELGVGARPQRHRVLEGERAEVGLGRVAVARPAPTPRAAPRGRRARPSGRCRTRTAP